jgi:hypothetical protein
MKKNFIIKLGFLYIIFLFSFVSLQAQTPQQFKYQAVLRDLSGNVIADEQKNIQIEILKGSTSGIVVFSETHSVTTTSNGNINLNIGSQNSMSAIDWSVDSYFLKISVDNIEFGISQLLSVPYALNAQFAETADYNSLSNLPILNSANWNSAFSWGNHADAGYLSSFTETDPEFALSPAYGISSSNISNWNSAYGWGNHASAGYLTSFTEADGSVSNEIQTLSLSGADLSISGGNTVTLPAGTAYSAGTGISIADGVISNTGDTNAANDFSGFYEELIGSPVNFYVSGSGDYPTYITDNVYREGSMALGFNVPTEGKLDIRQSGSGTTNAETTGLSVQNTNTSSADISGVKSVITSNSLGDQSAYISNITGSGGGSHYGVYNLLSGDGTGVQSGIFSEITTTGDQIHYGNYAELSGEGSGAHYGNYFLLKGTGTGGQLGENILISNSGNASHIGLRSILSGSGSGLHIGTDNILTGLGTGTQYGVKNTIDNSNTNIHYGVYNNLYGSGSGAHYGILNQLSGAGAGEQYGVKSSISNTGNGLHYAVRTDLSGTGSGTHLAMYNTISGSGSGNQYGIKTEITNTSTGTHYGNYALLSGSGVGAKYGSFNKIESTAGGTHYAVYGNATKAGSYAGYFEGDVKVSEKVLSDDSGDADMKAYIYGKITGTSSGASIVSTASSGGFSITRAAEGEYNVTFTNSPGSSSVYIVMTSFDRLDGYNPAISTINYPTYFKIFTEVQTGLGGLEAHDFNFSFVVYKK